jgi:hypothetical protein
MCEQARDDQVEKIEPSNDKKVLTHERPNSKPQCTTPFCNTQDPSSRVLCAECTNRRFSLSSTDSSDNSLEKIQEKSSVRTRPSDPSPYTAEPIPTKTDPIESDETKWCCELCDYSHNLNSNERCIYCEQGHRPQQITSSSTKHSERSSTHRDYDQLNKSGNIYL